MDFTSLANSASGAFDKTKSSVAGGINSVKDSASSIYGDTKSKLMEQLPQVLQDRLSGMGDELTTAMLQDINASVIASVSKEVPTDARTVLARLTGSESINAVQTSKEIITLNNLQMVSGMPPMGDNIVDPPPFINGNDLANDTKLSTARTYTDAFSTGLCGMDYIERCIISGQFLTIVPLTLKPDLFGNTFKKAKKYTNLTNISARLGVASYGLTASVSSRRYWRTYTMLLKAAALSLGVSVDTGGSYTESTLKKLLPKHMFDTLISREAETNMFKLVDNEKESIRLTEATKEYNDNRIKNVIEEAAKLVKIAADGETPYAQKWSSIKDMLRLGDVAPPSANTELVDFNTIVTNAGYNNFLRYTVNAEKDVLNSRLPIVSFYVNGVVERSFNSSSSVTESVIARDTTDLIRKGLTKDTEADNENVQKARAAMGDVSGYLDELAYHGSLPGKASFALSNTAIPSVISSTSTEYSFNVKITEQAIGSDPVSLLRVQDLYCKLVPFVTPVSDGSQNTVVPQSPLYCSAFVKGTMNVPRGAITNISITTNPSFQTSEGVPTVMDVSLTIQPLLAVSAIPDMGRFFSNTETSSIVASMYNPMSAFNILATMCGYNTVLSKFPFSLFDYFIQGKVSGFIANFKGTSNFVHTIANDFTATRSLQYGASLRIK